MVLCVFCAGSHGWPYVGFKIPTASAAAVADLGISLCEVHSKLTRPIRIKKACCTATHPPPNTLQCHSADQKWLGGIRPTSVRTVTLPALAEPAGFAMGVQESQREQRALIPYYRKVLTGRDGWGPPTPTVSAA